MVSTDVLGRYIRDFITEEEAAESICEIAKAAEVTPKEFYNLLTIFYRCDAGSYTEDAGGYKSLDHLFVFDRTTPSLAKVQKLEKALFGFDK